VTLGLVVAYTKMTFGDRNLTRGTIESQALVGSAAAYVAASKRVDPTTAILGAPLVLWSCSGAG